MNDELLERARSGDRDAFASLCEAHRGRVWRTVSSVTQRRVDAEDLAQETFIKAFLALHSYRGEASFGAWLTRIALNTAHDHQKSAWRRKVMFWRDDRPDEPDGGVTPSEYAERSERQRQIRAAVAKLAERERVPIHLIYFEDYSLAEVARLEGVPESTVRSRVKVGLQKLGRELGATETGDQPLPAFAQEGGRRQR